MKILVVGGGTAGFMSALILKNYLDVEVDVVYSKKIGTVGVGEGSTEHFKYFMDFCGIKNEEIIYETDATYKSSLVFDNWTENPYMHHVGKDLAQTRVQDFSLIYSKILSDDCSSLTPKNFWENKINDWFSEGGYPEAPMLQYHFNSEKLVKFLKNKAVQSGIGVFEDDVSEVKINESGNIDSVVGNKKKYEYDFFIDSTGFKRILISKLGAKWISHSKYLKMNSAIVFQTPDTEEYNLWSYARAMDSGWMFRTPTWGRHGNGYIYNKDYINAEQAKKEIEDYFGFEINIGREFSFDAGHVDRAWIKNCVAIGLSSSFIEPLEASAIGTAIQQSFLLSQAIANYDESTIKRYNWSFNSIMTNIRDFIALHYIVKKDNTQFWRDMQGIEIPDTLQDRLDLWKHKLPTREDFAHESDYILFKDSNFISILSGLKLYNKDYLKKEYEMLSPKIKNIAEQIILERNELESKIKTIGHKELIRKTRNDYMIKNNI
jgi:tryptophan halogenase